MQFLNNKIIPITYPSAAEFWLSPLSDTIRHTAPVSLPASFSLSISTAEACDAAFMLGLSEPLSLVTYNAAEIRRNSKFISRYQRLPFPENSFVEIRIKNYDYFIACPELCFMLAPRYLSFPMSVKLGTDLCAQYKINNHAQYNQSSCRPSTTTASLSDYVNRAHGFGCYKTAKTALQYVADNSNSPMESALAAAVSMDLIHGGYKLGRPIMNYKIELPMSEARLVGFGSIRTDLAWPQKKVAVEYNSNLTHLNSTQMSQDYNRLTALKNCGWNVICLTSANVADFNSLETIMSEIQSILGLPEDAQTRGKYKDLRRQTMAELFRHNVH